MMKSSLSLCFFAFLFVSTKTSLVLADGHDGIETECDVCHVNYYHKVCVCSLCFNHHHFLGDRVAAFRTFLFSEIYM